MRLDREQVRRQQLLQSLLELDKQALVWINAHHCRPLDAVLLPASYAGEGGAIWIVVCLALLVAGKAEERRIAIVLALTLLFMDRVISSSLGHWWYRERPYLAMEGIRQLGIPWRGSSFPSAHAHSVWIAAIILGSRWRRLAIPLVLFALLTCYSRPYFGMHYPLDAIVGSALGIAAGSAVVGVQTWRQGRKAAKRT